MTTRMLGTTLLTAPEHDRALWLMQFSGATQARALETVLAERRQRAERAVSGYANPAAYIAAEMERPTR